MKQARSRKANTAWNHLYVELKKTCQTVEKWLLGAGAWGKQGDVGKKKQLSPLR